MRDTFSSTNSLKGLAICAVLINHFLNLNINGDYLGFAGLFVSLFFMVSGYGIHYSLERSGFAATPRLKILLRFYFNRLVRIYPLFITAYLIQCLVFSDVMLTWTFLGIHALGHYWFIPAIMQCYLLAPFLFIGIKRHRFLSLNILVITFVTVNLLLNSASVPANIGWTLRFIHLHWRDVYCLYLLLFGLSMFLPLYFDSWAQVPSYEKKYFFILLVSVVLTIAIVFKYQESTYDLSSLFTKTICPLIILYTAAAYLISNNLQFPLLAWIGKAAYAIYLFHIIMYRSIDEIFGFGKNSPMEFLIIIAVIPLYFYLCTIVENWNNKVTKAIRLKS